MELKIKKFSELTTNELYDILKLRFDVFVIEQNCIYNELDNIDKEAIHLWFEENAEIASYLRIYIKDREKNEAVIGRVISAKRISGFGSLILKEGIKACKELLNAKSIYIEAQTYAIDFYRKHGFKEISEPFIMDGIEHIEMELNLK